MAGRKSLLFWGGICFTFFLKIQISSSSGFHNFHHVANAECRKINRFHRCNCLFGFTPPPTEFWFPARGSQTCTDINECRNSTVCPIDANCTNTEGSYHCSCNSGFASSNGKVNFTDRGVTCQDIDECQNPSVCPSDATCTNTEGSYHCMCNPGFASSNGKVNFTDQGVTCRENNSMCFNLAKNTFSRNCEQLNAASSQDGYQEICSSLKKLSQSCGSDATSLSLKNIASLFRTPPTLVTGNPAEIAQVMTFYLDAVQKSIYEVSLIQPPGSTASIKEKFMVITTLTIKGGCDKNNSTFKMEAGNETMDIDCAIITEKDSRGAAVLISYTSVGSILNENFISKGSLTTDEELVDIHLNSKVVSGTTGYRNASSLSTPVKFTFQHIKMRSGKQKPICVYWNNTGWSNQGCEIIWYDDSQTVCNCNHLSTFAILMASTKLKEDLVLTVITDVGLSLSLLCLFLAALIFLLCRAIQSVSTFLHLQLSLCLFLADFLFLTGIKRTQSKIVCSIIAGGLHYLYLAAFSWMFLEGLHLFLTVRNLKVANYTSASQFKKRFMYPFGYGIPAVTVAVSAGIGPQGYGTADYCWLNLHKGFIWSFMGPVFIITFINLSFYLTTLWILRDRLSSLNKEVSTIQNTRILTIKALAQLFLLGCSWSLGFFLIESITEPAQSIIAYTFTIINSLQGVYIFLVHCVLSRQVKEEFKKCFKKIKKRTETDTYILSSSTTHTKTLDMCERKKDATST